MRVKSLQLLCFKLANHQPKVVLMLEKYVTMHSQSGNEGDDMIPIESIEPIMTDFALIIGAIFIQYDAYMKGETAKKNDPKAIQKFTEYVKAKILE
jgi:predicted nucleotide-binding protein (sugar kinase/HSP70/actin superfamily)